MAFPGLYNEVAHVSTEPTTAPTAAALTHVLYTPTDVSIACDGQPEELSGHHC